VVSSLVVFRLIFWLRLLFPSRLILLGSFTSVLFQLIHTLIELYGIILGLSVSEIILALPHVEHVGNKK
jgi:hypothetical protein